jgi:hypothetical protein
MCRIASLFLIRRMKGRMSGDARDFNIKTRTVIIIFCFPASQGAEGNSRHSDRNFRETCIILCHRQKLCVCVFVDGWGCCSIETNFLALARIDNQFKRVRETRYKL